MGRPSMGEERREQILAAFETCVIRDGLEKTSLQNVAKEAGLPRPLVRHFAGNRADIIKLLVERMTDRADENLAQMRPADRRSNVDDLLNYLFSSVFSNSVTNKIILEMWHLSHRDPTIKRQLLKIYRRLSDHIVTQMEEDALGRDNAERQDVAYALMSLAYGDACFLILGMKGKRRLTIRAQANALLESLR